MDRMEPPSPSSSGHVMSSCRNPGGNSNIQLCQMGVSLPLNLTHNPQLPGLSVLASASLKVTACLALSNCQKRENRLGPRGCPVGPSRVRSGQCGEITPPPRKASTLEMGKVLEIAMQWAQISNFRSAFFFLLLAQNTQKPQFQVSDFWKAWFLAPSLSSGKHVSVLISPVTSMTMSYVSTQHKGGKKRSLTVTVSHINDCQTLRTQHIGEKAGLTVSQVLTHWGKVAQESPQNCTHRLP